MCNSFKISFRISTTSGTTANNVSTRLGCLNTRPLQRKGGPWVKHDSELTVPLFKKKLTIWFKSRIWTFKHMAKGEVTVLLLFLNLDVRCDGWWTPRPVRSASRERNPVPIVQEAGWGPSIGLNACGKTRLPLGFEPPNRPARSESLYRLSYPDPLETHHVYTNAVSPQVRYPPCLLAKTVMFYATPRVEHNSTLLIMSILQTILSTCQRPYHRSLFKQETFLLDKRREGQALPPQLTNPMEQSRYWKAKSSSAGQ
jgi:hypothetical protein